MSYGMSNPTSVAGPTGKVGNKIPSGYKAAQLQQFTPEQMKLFQEMFSQVSPDSFLSKIAGGDQSQFAQMEAPALRQFSELQGGLASRFSGMGSLGGRHSSGFQNAGTAAAGNFAQDLQSKRLELQRQAINDMMGYGNQLLGQRPYDSMLVQKQKPWWQEAAIGFSGGLGEGLGNAAGSFAGGF